MGIFVLFSQFLFRIDWPIRIFVLVAEAGILIFLWRCVCHVFVWISGIRPLCIDWAYDVIRDQVIARIQIPPEAMDTAK